MYMYGNVHILVKIPVWKPAFPIISLPWGHTSTARDLIGVGKDCPGYWLCPWFLSYFSDVHYVRYTHVHVRKRTYIGQNPCLKTGFPDNIASLGAYKYSQGLDRGWEGLSRVLTMSLIFVLFFRRPLCKVHACTCTETYIYWSKSLSENRLSR